MGITRRALITGASEGIGRTFATALASQGYAITAVARNESRLKSLIMNLPGEEHTFHCADLGSDQGIESVISKLKKEKFDLLVNNAGFGLVGEFLKEPIEKSLEMLKLNCETLARLSYAFLKDSKKGDALINVASTLGFSPVPHMAFYAATKAFVLSLSEGLASEHSARGVYVMTLCPGYTRTEFSKRAGIVDDSHFIQMELTPEQVVKIALNALKKRSCHMVVPGATNNFLLQIQRFLPRSATKKVMLKFFERAGRGKGLNKA